MLDIKLIRENVELVRQSLIKRKADFDLDAFLVLDQKRRDMIQQLDGLRSEHKKTSVLVSKVIDDSQKSAELIAQSKELSQKIDQLDQAFVAVKEQFEQQMLYLPNICHESVPVGPAAANEVTKTWGQLRQFDFEPKTHIELAAELGLIDFNKAATISGSNFVLFTGLGALLERALINFMLDLHTSQHGYTEIVPPLLVNPASMITCGQLPKFKEDMYHFGDDDFYLIPTAEVPLTNIYRDCVLDETQLPANYTAYTPCFRREAGSYGKDTRGLVRVHQFDKVELVKFARPQDSYAEHEKLLAQACRVLELLEIPYRVLKLASGDLSFAAAKCYDIEIYAPGLKRWLEVSSCSNFEDFQARRGNIKYKDKASGKKLYVHTLNGSGVALARLVIALMENYQTQEGTIVMPAALRGYFGQRTEIKK